MWTHNFHTECFYNFLYIIMLSVLNRNWWNGYTEGIGFWLEAQFCKCPTSIQQMPCIGEIEEEDPGKTMEENGATFSKLAWSNSPSEEWYRGATEGLGVWDSHPGDPTVCYTWTSAINGKHSVNRPFKLLTEHCHQQKIFGYWASKPPRENKQLHNSVKIQKSSIPPGIQSLLSTVTSNILQLRYQSGCDWNCK